ncbi:hypothetical protein PoB_001708900 [Plakobranchus ocellatus]|uniref:Uncharacterized protein n=1 Tax=Plakobranchus ocellatus TaxID=259542 RepID=A0AAV3Z5K1_9GAST|nr:hypothetical protein PoB_001708900 [Plakobranchus ocellatus]
MHDSFPDDHPESQFPNASPDSLSVTLVDDSSEFFGYVDLDHNPVHGPCHSPLIYLRHNPLPDPRHNPFLSPPYPSPWFCHTLPDPRGNLLPYPFSLILS